MNYYVYARRRATDLASVRFKLQRLFSFLASSDYEKLQSLLGEAEEILKRYH